MKNILITGAAGFIGFSLSKYLNEERIYGIDNLNDYYDVNLKKERLKILEGHQNFEFKKLDLSLDLNELNTIIKKNNFDTIIHLAAQAGVRYSLQNPLSYIQSNILGSVNLFEVLKKCNFQGHLIIASTSSVYGKREENSFKEIDKSDQQISLYSASKKSVESIAHSYSYNFGISTTLLRFFTIYGPWGRPDMALFKFVDAIYKNQSIDVFNDGDMWRDFTYIDDLTESIKRLIPIVPNLKNIVKNDSLSSVAPFRIVNIGNQNVVNLMKMIDILENITGKKAKKNFLPMQKGDVKYTLSDSSLLFELTGFKPSTPIEFGIEEFYKWYCNYHKIKY